MNDNFHIVLICRLLTLYFIKNDDFSIVSAERFFFSNENEIIFVEYNIRGDLLRTFIECVMNVIFGFQKILNKLQTIFCQFIVL